MSISRLLYQLDWQKNNSLVYLKGGVKLPRAINIIEDLGKGLKINEETWSGSKIEEEKTNEPKKDNAQNTEEKEE